MTSAPTNATPATRVALWLCFLVATIEGFDLQAAGVAAPLLAPAFKLGPAQMGLFFSAATIGLIVGALLGGRVADRVGRKPGLIVALALFGIFSIATAFAWSFPSLVVWRFLTGVGLGGALPNLIAVAAETSTPSRTSSRVAAMYAGMPIGGGVAGLVSLLEWHGGWSTIFLVGGAAPLVVTPLLVRFLPAVPLSTGTGASSMRLRAAHALFGQTRWITTLLLWAGFFLSLLVLYLLLNWLPALLVSRGIDRRGASTVQIVFNLAGAAGSIFAGRAMERYSHRAVVILSFSALIGALVVLAMVPATIGFALLAGMLVGITVMAVQAILYGLAPGQYPVAVRGTGVGAAVAAGRLGSVAGPLLAGTLLVAGRSGTDVLIGIVPIAAAGGLATLLLVIRLRFASDVRPAAAS